MGAGERERGRRCRGQGFHCGIAIEHLRASQSVQRQSDEHRRSRAARSIRAPRDDVREEATIDWNFGNTPDVSSDLVVDLLLYDFLQHMSPLRMYST